MFAICNLSLVPVRREPSDKSEMVSQLLFGEAVEIINKQDNWRKIKMLYDGYIGWIDKKQIVTVAENEINFLPILLTESYVELSEVAISPRNEVYRLIPPLFLEDFREPRPDLAPGLETELKEVVTLLAKNRWPFRLHATYDEIGRAHV